MGKARAVYLRCTGLLTSAAVGDHGLICLAAHFRRLGVVDFVRRGSRGVGSFIATEHGVC